MSVIALFYSGSDLIMDTQLGNMQVNESFSNLYLGFIKLLNVSTYVDKIILYILTAVGT